MQEAVLRLKNLGVPPKGFEDRIPHDEKTRELWDAWIDAVDSIQRPVTWEEAEILIKCCPTEYMAEVEWTMLHCIESCFQPEKPEQYKALVEQCNSDMMKEMLLKRLENYQKNKQ